MKFGGTSVGSVNSILNLKNIVEEAAKTEPVIVVVSALGGVTDKLIKISKMAVAGDEAFNDEFQAIVARHHDMIYAVITDEEKRNALLAEVDTLLNQLQNIYLGLSLINNTTSKTEATVVSYGERLSSRIVTALIDGAVRILEPGNLPFTDDLKKFHKEKLAERGRVEGREVSFQMVINDVYAIGKGRLVGHP